jgi:hypothetical protein
MRTATFFFLVMIASISCQFSNNDRHELILNGEWVFAKTGSFDEFPSSFSSSAPVPGLVDMASPSLDEQDTVYENAVYWYSRNFDALNTEVVRLKINKAKYFTKVYLNGQLVGENPYSFTPSNFNLKPYINKDAGENTLVIAVGCKNNLPDTVVNGNDFEKIKYIPGIYDDVKLIFTGNQFIQNIQVAPDIENSAVRVVAEIEKGYSDKTINLKYTIRELVSQNVVGKGEITADELESGTVACVNFSSKLSNVILWTPDNPFLYEIDVQTATDKLKTRFGMRTFRATKDSDVFLLNGKPYYMRGTNVCVFRFFEDPDRKDLPWDSKWITTLHQRFKEMHWNSIRYCIGFPPEKWYEIADSLGFLIQDEFPIWTGTDSFRDIQKELTSTHLAREFKDWLRERWNHPSVAIWDAQNESVTNVTGEAIQMIRHLDLSDRPWDNGWAAPVSETDPIESHPYLFVKYYVGEKPSQNGPLKDLLSDVHPPANDPNERSPSDNGHYYQNPVIVNEYAWLWLNRDGTPTLLTDKVYEVAFPEAVTKEQKYEVYARNMAILTEYWRAHRKCAAIMHFCGLGYSRSTPPRGHTSDNFIDLKQLIYEPKFFKYVKPAFSPVGLMVELWDKSFAASSEISFTIHLINDLDKTFESNLKLELFKDGEKIHEQTLHASAAPWEKALIEATMSLPGEKGNYELIAQIEYNGENVRSSRQFKID